MEVVELIKTESMTFGIFRVFAPSVENLRSKIAILAYFGLASLIIGGALVFYSERLPIRDSYVRDVSQDATDYVIERTKVDDVDQTSIKRSKVDQTIESDIDRVLDKKSPKDNFQNDVIRKKRS